ncbi:MAG TPA: hypothetical protein VFN67_14240, partial [Polyangiales bacterium]|nr:hypothetical protein [Polyangiales bacterium]
MQEARGASNAKVTGRPISPPAATDAALDAPPHVRGVAEPGDATLVSAMEICATVAGLAEPCWATPHVPGADLLGFCAIRDNTCAPAVVVCF